MPKADTIDPVVIVSGGSGAVQFQIAQGHGVAVFYKIIAEGTTVNEDFSSSSSTGERLLLARGYYPANKDNSSNSNKFLWTAGAAAFPITTEITFGSASNGQSFYEVEDAGGIVTVPPAELIRVKTVSSGGTSSTIPDRSFAGINLTDADVPIAVSGSSATVVSVALAAVKYEIDTATMTLAPSVAVHLGYMRGISVR